MSTGHPPPGWYDDPTQSGAARWWDGAQWTTHVQMLQPPIPVPPPAPAPPPAPMAPVLPPQAATTEFAPSWSEHAWSEDTTFHRTDLERRAWWQRKRVLISAGVVTLAMVATALVGSTDPDEAAVDAVEAGTDQLDDRINPLTGDAGGDRSTTAPPASSTSTTVESLTTTSVPPTTVTSTTSLVEGSTTLGGAAVSSSSTTATTATTAAPTTTTSPPSTTAAPTTAPPTTPAPTTTAAPTTTTSNCHPAYSPCIDFFPGDALNCDDLSSSQKPVTVRDVNVDPYGLDGNNDGIGCESG